MNAKSVLSVPYRIARTPIAVLTSAVGSRLPDNSRPRLVLNRTLGSTDRFAGRLFGNRTLVEDGTSRIERSEQLAQAAELETKAQQRREQADTAARSGRQAAADKAKQARKRATDGLHEAAETERRGKEKAASDARSVAARKKQAADAKAKQRVETIEQGVEQVEAATNARTRGAKQRTAEKVADAQQRRSSARAKREDANELGELAAAKRTARKQT